MKTILVPTELSPDSFHFRKVIEVVKESSVPTKVLLVNTYLASDKDPQTIIELNDQLKLNSKQGLQLMQLELSSKVENPLIVWETLCFMGSLKNVLKLLTKTDLIDLVILSPETPQLRVIIDSLEDVDCMVTVREEENFGRQSCRS